MAYLILVQLFQHLYMLVACGLKKSLQRSPLMEKNLFNIKDYADLLQKFILIIRTVLVS